MKTYYCPSCMGEELVLVRRDKANTPTWAEGKRYAECESCGWRGGKNSLLRDRETETGENLPPHVEWEGRRPERDWVALPTVARVYTCAPAWAAYKARLVYRTEAHATKARDVMVKLVGGEHV